MTLPESWAEIRQRQGGNLAIVDATIEWDGEKLSESVTIPVPPHLNPLLIAIDNQPDVALGMVFEHCIRSEEGYSSVQIGSGENGVVTITADEPGPVGDEYSIWVKLPEDPDPEGTDLEVELVGKVIVVTLAVDELGAPDDTKNTAALIAAAIDELEGFGAAASGTGETPFTEAIESVAFTGGVVETWATLYDAEGNDLEITIPGNTTRVYGPFYRFPRFLGGRITLTAALAPGDGETTLVQVREV